MALQVRRWYASNHMLPDGWRQIIIGGEAQFNYEFFPKREGSDHLHNLTFLAETFDGPNTDNNLYPFVFLNSNGNLFIFANNRAILYDYTGAGKVVRTYPAIPGGEPRSYPSTGSVVLLPINLKAKAIEAEVLVCGGAPKGAVVDVIKKKIFRPALKTCARMKISDPNPQWILEEMPTVRVMRDMTLLPNGQVLIINGASEGVAGWDRARKPVLSPLVYRPANQAGSRFEMQNATTIPRMYHSTAVLLRDGRVLVRGSDPHQCYVFTGPFPTDLSLEAFCLDYLDSRFASLRPSISSAPESQVQVVYGQNLIIQFSAGGEICISVTMVSPSFTTHSFSQNQRLLILDSEMPRETSMGQFEILVKMPSSAFLAPAGYYLVFVVNQNIPSQGIWIHIK